MREERDISRHFGHGQRKKPFLQLEARRRTDGASQRIKRGHIRVALTIDWRSLRQIIGRLFREELVGLRLKGPRVDARVRTLMHPRSC